MRTRTYVLFQRFPFLWFGFVTRTYNLPTHKVELNLNDLPSVMG